MFLTINKVFAVFLTVIALLWVAQLNTLAVAMGISALVIAWGVWQRPRWAYFAAAAWCFGMLRTAMDKDNTLHAGVLEGLKHGLMVFYFVGIVLSIVLHEKVAIKPRKPADTDDVKNQPPP